MEKEYLNRRDTDIGHLIAFFRTKDQVPAAAEVRLRRDGLLRDVETDVSKEIKQTVATNKAAKAELMAYVKALCVKRPQVETYQHHSLGKILSKFKHIPASCLKTELTPSALKLMATLEVKKPARGGRC